MSPIETIEALYSACRDKNHDLFKKLCHEDIEWIQSEGFPNGGTHRGPDAIVKNVFSRFHDEWEFFKFERDEIYESKNGFRVTALGRYLGKHKPGSRLIEAHAAHVYDLKGGRITRFRQYADTAVLTAAKR